MCGIAGIILKNKTNLPALQTVLKMSQSIQHRGPDGEGILAINEINTTPLATRYTPSFKNGNIPYLPHLNHQQYAQESSAFFAHRRLSIIDLEETGHQPMCDATKSVWITFNGEIYNYKELRNELSNEGYVFNSTSDTEVVLNAYLHWGKNCLSKFNGMWSFCIYSSVHQAYFASRDRLGVKPFYFINNENFWAFASEQKAFIKSGLIHARFTDDQALNYITNNELEYKTSNFFEGVEELWPGHYLEYNSLNKELKTECYYNLNEIENSQNDSLTNADLISQIRKKLINSIDWRLRSDVEVGTCLSGGIDSSIIAGIMAGKTAKPVSCFTAVFSAGAANELPYAKLLSQHIQAKHFTTEPTLFEFENDFSTLIYALDVPIWDTSTYAQYRVMKLAKEHGIKVVLDGQGADELFAGYHHHFLAYWKQLLKEDGLVPFMKSLKESGKCIPKPFHFLLKQSIKENIFKESNAQIHLLNKDLLKAHPSEKSHKTLSRLNLQLIDDLGSKRLKSFLRCEDRCGMWHSVESRTPFSDDVELMELLFSFNGKRKIQHGVSKYLLREAGKEFIPDKIYRRYDKVGFETPMNTWVTNMLPEIISVLNNTSQPYINKNKLSKSAYTPGEIKVLFKLYVLTKWQEVFNNAFSPVS